MRSLGFLGVLGAVAATWGCSSNEGGPGGASDGGGGSTHSSEATGGKGGAGGTGASDPGSQGVFVAVGYGGRRVRSTDDGETWTNDVSLAEPGGDDDNLLRTITFAKGQFLALGWRAMTSRDGKTWKDHGTTLGQWVGSVAYGENTFVAIGGYGMRWTSKDGLAWAHHDINTVAAHTHNGLVYGDGRFVMTDDLGDRTWSDDGENWHVTDGAFETPTRELAFGGGVFVGIGGRNVARSEDGGEVWATVAMLSEDVTGLVYAEGHFTAIGPGHVYTSEDGLAWEDHEVPGIVGGGLAYGHGTYILVQGATRRRSKDGIAWDPPVEDGKNAFEWVAFGMPE